MCHYTLHLAERQRGAIEDEEAEEEQEEEVRERFQISTFIPAQDNFRSIKTLIRHRRANKSDTGGGGMAGFGWGESAEKNTSFSTTGFSFYL